MPKRSNNKDISLNHDNSTYTFKLSNTKNWQYFRFNPGHLKYSFYRSGPKEIENYYLGTDIVNASSVYCDIDKENDNWSVMHNAYSPYYVLDGLKETAWIERSNTGGKGESITISFPDNYEAKGFSIINGNCNSKESFINYNRIKTLEVIYGNEKEVVSLIDSVEIQKFNFNNKQKINFVEFKILDVYKGKKFNKAAISEIDIF